MRAGLELRVGERQVLAHTRQAAHVDLELEIAEIRRRVRHDQSNRCAERALSRRAAGGGRRDTGKHVPEVGLGRDRRNRTVASHRTRDVHRDTLGRVAAGLIHFLYLGGPPVGHGWLRYLAVHADGGPLAQRRRAHPLLAMADQRTESQRPTGGEMRLA